MARNHVGNSSFDSANSAKLASDSLPLQRLRWYTSRTFDVPTAGRTAAFTANPLGLTGLHQCHARSLLGTVTLDKAPGLIPA